MAVPCFISAERPPKITEQAGQSWDRALWDRLAHDVTAGGGGADTMLRVVIFSRLRGWPVATPFGAFLTSCP